MIPAARSLRTWGRNGALPACRSGSTFIDKAKALGANALLGQFTASERFDRVLKGLTVESIDKGRIMCTMLVDEGVQNAYKTLHGGAVSTIVDVVGTMALLSIDATKPGVSVDLNVSFATAAKASSIVQIEGKVLKMGKRLGFTTVDIRREDGALVATGRHTKAFK